MQPAAQAKTPRRQKHSSHRFYRSYVVRPAAVAPGVLAVVVTVPADEVLAEHSPVAALHVHHLDGTKETIYCCTSADIRLCEHTRKKVLAARPLASLS